MFEAAVTAGLLHNVAADKKNTRPPLIRWFHLVDLFWSFEENLCFFFLIRFFFSLPVLISKENMIAASGINQYQIKCSEEIMVNAPSSFQGPQKI